MYKLNKIQGFVAMPIIIGSAILVVGVLGGLAYEYKNDKSILSSINKNNLLAQVSGITNPTITVLSPNGGENFLQEKDMVITWTSANMGSLNVEIDLLNTSGAIMENYRIVLETTNTGSYTWTIPSTLPIGSYKIFVSSKDRGPSAGDYSDTFFNIVSATDNLKIISPSSGEQLTAGQTYSVRWTGLSSGNNEYSVYLIGGTLYSSGVFLGTAQEMDKDIKSVSVMIPSNLSAASNYQIKFIGKAFESTSEVFRVNIPPLPIITGLSQTSGPIGTKLQVYGNNLSNIISATLTQRLCCKYYKGTSYPVEWSSVSNTEFGIPIPSIASGDYIIDVCTSSGCSSSSVESVDTPVFTISAPSSIKVINPNGGENLLRGSSIDITWADSGLISSDFLHIYLYKGNNIVEGKDAIGSVYYSGSFPVLDQITSPANGKDSFTWTIPASLPDGSDYRIGIVGAGEFDQSDSPLTITAPVIDNLRIISPSSGEQLTAGQTYSVRWTGLSSGNNEYSVYLIGGIDRSQWSLGTAYEMDKDIKSVSVTIPSNVPNSSSYQIRFIGKAWQSDSDFFTIIAKPTCTASTSCVPQYCQYAGDLQNCTVTNTDCSTSSYTTGSCATTPPMPTCTASTSCVSQYCQYGGDLKKCTVRKTDCSASSYTTGGCKSAPSTFTVCDSTAKAIVDSVGGCEKIDKALYSNIYNVCCVSVVVTKESLLSLLNTALANGVISSTEKTALLTALNSYLK